MASTEADARDRADMKQLQSGDDEALNRLMERHAPAVMNFLLRMLNSESDAEDLAQETFVRVFRARASFRPQARFSTWLYTIAANLARNEWRRRARHPDVPLETSDPARPDLSDRLASTGNNPDSALLAEERAALVRESVSRLPEDLREALVLCEWEELSMAEAAGVLETTAKAVESRLYRARKLLRAQLQQWL